MVSRPDGDDNSVEAWQTATAAETTTAAAVTLVSDAATTPAATKSAADGGQSAMTILQQLICSKNRKPLTIETKDIGIQALDAILQLSVGCRLTI